MDRTVAAAVVIAQLAIPLALLVRAIRRWDDRPKRRPERSKAAATPAADVPPLTALRCAACGAPVPLLAASFPCPHCAAPVRAPDEYVRVLALRARAREDLARAERIWLRSRITASPLVLWPARLATIAVFAVVVKACSALHAARWPEGVIIAASMLSLVQVVVLLAAIQVFASLRRLAPVAPLRCELPAGVDDCRRCGAPIAFDAGAFSGSCPYCEADNYRGALAIRARVDAGERHEQVERTLLEAIDEWRERVGGLELVTILLGFAAALAVLGALFSFLDDLW